MTETESGAEFISEAHVRHIMRYVQARDWLTDRHYKVLDAACGTGYGSKLLAKDHYVTGIDFDMDALIEANRVPVKNCHFEMANLVSSPKFGCGAIVSIETLEHFNETTGALILQRFYDWLPQLGVLIVSTPYCEQSGPSPITKQHLWEYSLTDFEQVLANTGFEIDCIKVQRHEGKAGRLGYAMTKAIKR
jgi:2-polyprenyl-3-methyl-5-hydroxy-6-metoxy-1,4-benzoquinol methylase